MSGVVALTQRVQVIPEYGERRDCLDQAWVGLCQALSWTPLPVPNGLADPRAFLRQLGATALILTGGNDLACLPGARTPAPERDATERALLDHCLEENLPVLGVCRGAQLIQHHFGGALQPCPGHVAVRHPVESRHPDWPGGFTVNSYHDYCIRDLAPGLEALVSAPDGSVEAFHRPGQRLTAVLWHPERESPLDPRDLELFRRTLCAL